MIIRILILLISIVALSQGEDLDKKKKRVIISQIGEEQYRMRIYLNHENPYQTQVETSKSENQLETVLPIPDRFEVIGMREYLRYKTGMSVASEGSYLLGYLNENVIHQSKLVSELSAGSVEDVLFQIPVDKLYEGYNNLKILILQSSTQKNVGSGLSGPSSDSGNPMFSAKENTIEKCQRVAGSWASSSALSKMWTQIDIENSYIELDFNIKPFEEKISSIYKFMFDNKSLKKGKINFVFPEIPDDDDFYNYAFISNYISRVLEFKDIDIFVSTEPNDNMHNIVISKRDKLEELFKKYGDDFNISKKSVGNINLIQNPANSINGILLITGDNQEQIESSLYQLLDENIKLLDSQYLVVAKREKPPKEPPFTTPNFIQFNKPVMFSDPTLFNHDMCSDSYISTFSANFKIYPIVVFDDDGEEHFEVVLNYFSLRSPAIQLVFNIYINGVFSHQFFQKEEFKNISEIISESTYFSPALLKYGNNRIDVEIVKYQKNTTTYGLAAIQTTIRDDSYFSVPKTESRTELPNLKYVSEMAFPFSIYPDLQNTGILITDFHADTIASAFQTVFQLGKIMKYPPYYLTVTYDINRVLDKDIIVVGSQIKEYAPLYKNAPIKFTEDGMLKEHYIEDLNRTVVTKEIADFNDIFLAQTYQSIFNPKRVVFELSAKKPSTLLKGVQEGFIPSQLADFDGDVWFYNVETEDTKSFRYGKKYYVEEIVEGFKNRFDSDKYKDIEGF